MIHNCWIKCRHPLGTSLSCGTTRYILRRTSWRKHINTKNCLPLPLSKAFFVPPYWRRQISFCLTFFTKWGATWILRLYGLNITYHDDMTVRLTGTMNLSHLYYMLPLEFVTNQVKRIWPKLGSTRACTKLVHRLALNNSIDVLLLSFHPSAGEAF